MALALDMLASCRAFLSSVDLLLLSNSLDMLGIEVHHYSCQPCRDHVCVLLCFICMPFVNKPSSHTNYLAN